MSDVVNITTLFGEFANWNELQVYSNQQFIALDKANKRMLEMEVEIAHLKELLTTTATLIQDNTAKVIVTPAEAIIKAQIDLLQSRALNKELTLEEVKKLDLFIKNLRLIQGEATTIDGSKKLDRSNLTDAEILKIAHTKDEIDGQS